MLWKLNTLFILITLYLQLAWLKLLEGESETSYQTMTHVYMVLYSN